MQKKAFVSRVFKMSFVMLLVNISGICYSVFVSRRAGAQGIGMFHLVMSVYSVGITVSVSGIGLTVTRLISDMPRSVAVKCADSVVIKCLKLCLVPSFLAMLIIFFSADTVATKLLGDPRCGFCLRILAPGLLCTAFSTVLCGYFTAFGHVGAISFGKLVSDTVNWLVTVFLLANLPREDTYIAVVISLCFSTVAECICYMILWKRMQNKLFCKNGTDYKSILGLCAPIAVGSYLRTGLTSVENLLIPAMLSVYGVVNPVASYGIIKGMTLPILMFPTVFTGAFTSLIVPEIAKRRTLGHKNSLRYISSLSIEYILRFAVFVSAVFFKWHKEISITFFSESDSGKYLGMLCLFPVFMFTDSVVDSLLKGLDKQVTSLKINIIDSFCRVVVIILFVPRVGMGAYIAVMYLSEIINLFFSYYTLKKCAGCVLSPAKFLGMPMMCAALGIMVVSCVPIHSIWAQISAFSGIYIMGSCIFSKLTKG